MTHRLVALSEARWENANLASWWWAAAPMSTVPPDLKYRGELVWSVDCHFGNDDREPRITFIRKRTE